MSCEVRPLEARDAAAALEVIAARDLADVGFVDYTLDDVHNDLERPDVDSWLAELDGVIRGWAVLDSMGAMVAVHPDAEGRGVGAALRAVVEARTRDRGQRVLSQGIWATNAAARRALQSAGYSLAHVYRTLEVDLADAAPTREAPGLRPLRRPEDERAAHEVMTVAFREIEGNRDQPFADWLAETLDRRGATDPVNLVVEDEEGLAALLQGRAREKVGFVDVLATAPRARGRGHARALLLAAFEHYRRRGYSLCGLSVHARNDSAQGLYASVGMAEVRRAERWEKPA